MKRNKDREWYISGLLRDWSPPSEENVFLSISGRQPFLHYSSTVLSSELITAVVMDNEQSSFADKYFDPCPCPASLKSNGKQKGPIAETFSPVCPKEMVSVQKKAPNKWRASFKLIGITLTATRECSENFFLLGECKD